MVRKSPVSNKFFRIYLNLLVRAFAQFSGLQVSESRALAIRQGLQVFTTVFMLFISVSCEETEFYPVETAPQSVSDDESGDEGRNRTGDDESRTTDTPGTDDNIDPNANPDDQNPGSDNEGVVLVSESFSQTDEENQFDILWVIDDSGSMGNDQAQLASNFQSFIQSFDGSSVDFQMAIITTDATPGISGEPVAGSIESLSSQDYASDAAQFVSDFQSMINVGTSGSGYERGLQTSYDFMNNYGDSYLRNNANLIVVYVSDEEDQSPLSVASYYSALSGTKSNQGKFKAYSIVDTQTTGTGLTHGGQRYIDMADLSSGKTNEISNDFHTTLASIGNQIAELSDSFPLKSRPIAGSIIVKVDGVSQNNGWVYQSATNSIKFLDGFIPSFGAQIQVEYNKES